MDIVTIGASCLQVIDACTMVKNYLGGKHFIVIFRNYFCLNSDRTLLAEDQI